MTRMKLSYQVPKPIFGQVKQHVSSWKGTQKNLRHIETFVGRKVYDIWKVVTSLGYVTFAHPRLWRLLSKISLWEWDFCFLKYISIIFADQITCTDIWDHTSEKNITILSCEFVKTIIIKEGSSIIWMIISRKEMITLKIIITWNSLAT